MTPDTIKQHAQCPKCKKDLVYRVKVPGLRREIRCPCGNRFVVNDEKAQAARRVHDLMREIFG